MPASLPGAEDLRRAAHQLAARLPSSLAPLAHVAYNYRWSWVAGGEPLFASLDPHRWDVCGRNPVRLLQEASPVALEQAAANADFCRRAGVLERAVFAEPRVATAHHIPPDRPVAFFCSEYGIHSSLPIYAGGLGVLAGDFLKVASDFGVPMVAIGLLYRQGYFRQRIDTLGWQHEYWIDIDPERLPTVLVTRDDGRTPLTIQVPIRGHEVVAQIWRVDVGHVPLFLLDTDRADNRLVDRWIVARLYVGDRDTRLAQYALLGLGGVRALQALGIEPSVIHLNEGHASLAAVELTATAVATGRPFLEAFAATRRRTVFTTHTPVAAGNETYSTEELQRMHPGLPARLGTDWNALFALARVHPADPAEQLGVTTFGLRVSRSANGVSKRHGQIARAMWREVFGAPTAEQVPIGHVTNGVHIATWMAGPMRELLDDYLGADWLDRVHDPGTWAKVDAIPDKALWATRCGLRADLLQYARERATIDRLARGESQDYVELAARAFDPARLTIGFARRLATYKRLHLLFRNLPRALELLGKDHRSIQIILAGKAHPMDEGAKRVVQMLFEAKGAPYVGERIAYLHDYDMEIARHLVAGCDLWLNLPRPPYEASGTSGMKCALNGGLHLSILDGWWVEGYNGQNGWAIEGDPAGDPDACDERDTNAVLGLIEREIVPLFYERDADGIPRGWLPRVRAAIKTAGLRFGAQRMLGDYVEQIYRE